MPPGLRHRWSLTLRMAALSVWVRSQWTGIRISASEPLIGAFPNVALFLIILGGTAGNTSEAE